MGKVDDEKLMLTDDENYQKMITKGKLKNEYDYINPTHYVQDDGRQTWEHMLDHWTYEQVALWCEMTAFKYKERIGKKPNEHPKRELDKIEWYDSKAKELREKANL